MNRADAQINDFDNGQQVSPEESVKEIMKLRRFLSEPPVVFRQITRARNRKFIADGLFRGQSSAFFACMTELPKMRIRPNAGVHFRQ